MRQKSPRPGVPSPRVGNMLPCKSLELCLKKLGFPLSPASALPGLGGWGLLSGMKRQRHWRQMFWRDASAIISLVRLCSQSPCHMQAPDWAPGTPQWTRSTRSLPSRGFSASDGDVSSRHRRLLSTCHAPGHTGGYSRQSSLPLSELTHEFWEADGNMKCITHEGEPVLIGAMEKNKNKDK